RPFREASPAAPASPSPPFRPGTAKARARVKATGARGEAGRGGCRSWARGLRARLLEHVGGHLAEVLHDEPAPRRRAAQVLDVLVEGPPQLGVALPQAVGQARRRAEKQAELQR